MGMFTGYSKSQPLDTQAHIIANIVTLRTYVGSEHRKLYYATGRLTTKEAEAFIAVSDHLLELIEADTINDQETEPLDNPS